MPCRRLSRRAFFGRFAPAGVRRRDRGVGVGPGAASVGVRRRLLRVLAGSAIALVIVALFGIAFQGAAAGGIGLGRAFSWEVVSSVAETRFGRLSLVRAAFAAVLAVMVVLVLRAGGRMSRPVMVAAILLRARPGGDAWALRARERERGGGAGGGAAHVGTAAVWVGGSRSWSRRSCSPARSVAARGLQRAAVFGDGGCVGGDPAGCGHRQRLFAGACLARAVEHAVRRAVAREGRLVVVLLGFGAYNNRYAVPRLRAQIASCSSGAGLCVSRAPSSSSSRPSSLSRRRWSMRRLRAPRSRCTARM